jgi:hypothetical protein
MGGWSEQLQLTPPRNHTWGWPGLLRGCSQGRLDDDGHDERVGTSGWGWAELCHYGEGSQLHPGRNWCLGQWGRGSGGGTRGLLNKPEQRAAQPKPSWLQLVTLGDDSWLAGWGAPGCFCKLHGPWQTSRCIIA